MTIPDNPHIQGAFFKAIGYLDRSKNIGVSISGGSDSDIALDFMHQCGVLDRCQVFIFDTGLEYQATWEHIDYLKDRYGIEIDRIRAKQSIPSCCKQYGQPFISKMVSMNIERLQRAGFDWSDDRPFEQLVNDYQGVRWNLKWWTNNNQNLRMSNISYNRFLKEFLMDHPPKHKISQVCCQRAKKDTAKEYYKKANLDIVVLGLRQAEGGVRAIRYKSCYESQEKGPDKYMPIWWFTDQDKKEYKRFYSICNSKCYTQYGMRRTGCAGCPFDLQLKTTMEIMKDHEPKLYRAVSNVFGKSHELTEQYHQYRAVKYAEEKRAKMKTQPLEAWAQ